jgi:hypothetical protein
MAEQGTGYEYLGNAAEMRIESDERGFELHFETDQGCYVVNVHGCAVDLLQAVNREIEPWWIEGELVLREFQKRVAIGDDSAYELTDPKHPRYHENNAGIWDNREGK